MSNAVVTAKCVACGKKREVRAGEVPNGDMPMCECGSPMVAVSAALEDAPDEPWGPEDIDPPEPDLDEPEGLDEPDPDYEDEPLEPD